MLHPRDQQRINQLIREGYGFQAKPNGCELIKPGGHLQVFPTFRMLRDHLKELNVWQVNNSTAN